VTVGFHEDFLPSKGNLGSARFAWARIAPTREGEHTRLRRDLMLDRHDSFGSSTGCSLSRRGFVPSRFGGENLLRRYEQST
jgi:hypothetical protein